MTGIQALFIAVVVLVALGFVSWPLLTGRRGGAAAQAAPPQHRALELEEERRAVYRALRELDFDHEAGHLSDDDYAGLRARYESRAAEVLTALDALGPRPAVVEAPPAPPAPPAARGWTRHPATLAAGAALTLVFGVVIGLNAGRFTEPDQTVIPPGSRIPVPVAPDSGPSMPPVAGQADAGRTMPPMVGQADAGRTMPPVPGVEPGKPLPPQILAGMLNAARESLAAGRYSEAIAAYQAVLKRDPKNVDAMSHLGLIVAIGGHADAALESFGKALAIDPQYAPAYLFRGQVLYEVKRDYPGAVQAWERFLQLVPDGEDHRRVTELVKEARAKRGP
jgi:tetratricopeptide (TPR) repeat protein